MAQNKPERFRLSLVNAAEDVPRLMRAYGRACGGEFALVLRPTEGRGALVRVAGDEATMWRAGDSDAPAAPQTAIAPRDAVALVKTEQKAVPKSGPITLRGQWSGWLHCDDGAPRVELSRKLAAYGTLRIVSSAEGQWAWTVERAKRWFSEPDSDSGTTPTLLGAIEAGLARAMGVLGEACSTRDSHRRAALDESWAAGHPIRPAKEGKDPTERLRPKEPRRKKAAEPLRMDAPVALPDAPATATGVQRMADDIAHEADALAAIRDVSWVWRDSTALEDAATWLRGVGLDDLADELDAYDTAPEHPPERLLEHLRGQLDEADLAAPVRKDAVAVLMRLEEAFHTAPYVLERARRLVRHAARLAESGLCRGRERKEAAEAISRAIHAYDEARAAIASGEAAQTRAKVRSMGEWAALAAAKAARACAAGQATLELPAASRPEPPKPPGKTKRAEPAPLPTPRKSRRKKASIPEPPPGAPERARRPRKSPPTEPEGEAAKDALLLDAFRDAISEALREAA